MVFPPRPLSLNGLQKEEKDAFKVSLRAKSFANPFKTFTMPLFALRD
jgi:hypothetical protein